MSNVTIPYLSKMSRFFILSKKCQGFSFCSKNATNLSSMQGTDISLVAVVCPPICLVVLRLRIHCLLPVVLSKVFCILMGGGKSRGGKAVSACPLLKCQLLLRIESVGRTIFLYLLLYQDPCSQ